MTAPAIMIPDQVEDRVVLGDSTSDGFLARMHGRWRDQTLRAARHRIRAVAPAVDTMKALDGAWVACVAR
jgi:hypothetical protein